MDNSVKKKSANNHFMSHFFLLLLTKSVLPPVFGSCCFLSPLILFPVLVINCWVGLLPHKHRKWSELWSQVIVLCIESCFKVYNRFAHPNNVIGVRLVIVMVTTCIASTIQHEMPGGTVVVHGTWGMKCRLFLNRDLLLDLFWSILE